jgi:excisionase family DNA binding protein
MPMLDPHALYNLTEAADRLRIGVRTVRRMIDGGSLASVKIGSRVLITEAAIRSYVGDHEVTARRPAYRIRGRAA